MRFRGPGLLAVLPVVFGLAACGGGGGDGVASANGGSASPTASASASMDPHEAALKFAQCMRQHGVQMEDPKGGDDGRVSIKINAKGVPRAKMDAAQKACQHFMKAGGGPKGKVSAEQRDQMLKFAQCMRQHGVNVPDPKPGQGLRMTVPNGSRAKFEDAQKACHKYQGDGGAGLTDQKDGR